MARVFSTDLIFLSRSFDVVYGSLSEVCKDTEGALETARSVVRPCALQRGGV